MSTTDGSGWGGARPRAGHPRKRLYLRDLPRELVRELEARAEEANVSVEEIGRRALEFYVAHTPPPATTRPPSESERRRLAREERAHLDGLGRAAGRQPPPSPER